MPSRTALNFALDSALLLIFCGLAWTFALFRFVFPPACSAGGWTLWGLSYEDWASVHFFCFCLFALCILVHVMLHWSWVCGVIASRLSRWRARPIRWDDGTQTLLGVGLLIVLLHVVGAGVFAALVAVHPPV